MRRLQYFDSVHVPLYTIAVWPSVALHLIAGAAILIGFKTRWAAALLALFCLATAFGVHLPAGDLENMTNFYKNLVMTGGFLLRDDVWRRRIQRGSGSGLAAHLLPMCARSAIKLFVA